MIYSSVDEIKKKEKKYKLILADPPWGYSTKIFGQKSDDCYKTMTEKEVADMPILDIVEDNAVLLMWITAPKLACGAHVDIFKNWGFIPSTIFAVWEKMSIMDGKPIGNPQGWYTKQCYEYVVMGRRGLLKDLRNKKSTEHNRMQAKRRGHSVKPDELYDKIKRVFPYIEEKDCLELFARRSYGDWDAMGNEVDDENNSDPINKKKRTKKRQEEEKNAKRRRKKKESST